MCLLTYHTWNHVETYMSIVIVLSDQHYTSVHFDFIFWTGQGIYWFNNYVLFFESMYTVSDKSVRRFWVVSNTKLHWVDALGGSFFKIFLIIIDGNNITVGYLLDLLNSSFQVFEFQKLKKFRKNTKHS